MTLIEVLLPDGSTHVYMTEQRSVNAIAQEANQRYPDATVWRKSVDWRLTENGKPADGLPPVLSTLKAAIIVVVLALILTPVVTYIASIDGSHVFGAHQFSQANAEPASTHDPADDESTVADAPGEVSIVNVATQQSDTSMTLRVLVRNDDAMPHNDIVVSAVFLDASGEVVPTEDGGSATISLEPGEEGYVKLWAHNEVGVAEYELAFEQ